MSEIDLLPAWYVQQRRQRRDRVIRYAYFAVVVLAMAGLAVVRRGQTASASDALAAMRHQMHSADPIESALADFQLRWKAAEQKKRLVLDAGGGVRSHALLAELSHMLPDGTVLTTLHLVKGARLPTGDAAPIPSKSGSAPSGTATPDGRLEIEGLAASDAQVGRLLAGLNRSGAFVDVKLGYSRTVQIEDREARAFGLACRVPQFE